MNSEQYPTKENYKLLQGNCFELMKNILDESVDMILCDLPYGTTDCKWDVIIPFESLWEQYKRIIKKQWCYSFILNTTIHNEIDSKQFQTFSLLLVLEKE